MTVRAKFKVQEVAKQAGYGQEGHIMSRVRLSAVSDEANKTWAKYTPSGSLEMQIDNPEALNQFEVGQFVFVDFTPAPAKEVDEAGGATAP